MWIADGANHNTVGTPALADRNVSGGAIKGLALYGPGTDFNTIQNNLFCITPDGSGTAECAVGTDFSFGPKHNLIGGTGARERNVYGRTRQNGIEFAHGIDKGSDLTWVNAYNSIVNNWIGFRADGSYNASYLSGYVAPRDAANDSNGINIADCSSFNIVDGNFIGSVYDGINLMWANQTGDIVRNNTIGLSPLGQTAPLARYGVNIRNGAHNHTIVGNTIRNAGTYGIALIQKDDSAIEISQNIIKDMSGRPVFLISGANGGVQPPAINSATASAISGNAAAGATVEVYRASRGAGQNGLPILYLGSATANGSGAWSLAVSLSVGDVISALQTGANKNSSALANNVAVTKGGGGGQPVAPIADFSWNQQSGTLTASFSDTSTGGTATSWSWTFGDGATSTSQNPSHTFAAAGTYSVKLTASNAQGSSSATKSVVINASTQTSYVVDDFSRTLSTGWGSANTGGAYTVTNSASNYKVLNGAGSMLLPQPNSNASAILYGVTARDVDIKFRFALDNAPAGGSVIVYAPARRTSGGEYRPRISLNADGTVQISVSKLVGTTETKVGGAVAVPGVTIAAGSYIWFRAQVFGTGTTTIRVKAWVAGQAEPAWQLSVADTQAALQGAGNLGFRLYMAATVTNSPIQVAFDDYTVDPT
jgi:PKD repeat protein